VWGVGRRIGEVTLWLIEAVQCCLMNLIISLSDELEARTPSANPTQSSRPQLTLPSTPQPPNSPTPKLSNPSPEPRPPDGLLEVSGYVGSDSTVQNVVGMAQLAAGVLFAGPGAAPVQDTSWIFGGRAREVAVDCRPPQKVVVDGELLGTTPVRARVVPACLRVLVPRPVVVGEEEEEAREERAVADAGASAAAAAAEAGLDSGEREDFEIAALGAASAAAQSANATTAAGMQSSAAVVEDWTALDDQPEVAQDQFDDEFDDDDYKVVPVEGIESESSSDGGGSGSGSADEGGAGRSGGVQKDKE